MLKCLGARSQQIISVYMLQMLTLVCNQMGMKTSQDRELKEMVEKTPIAHLAHELAQNLENPRDTTEPPPGAAA